MYLFMRIALIACILAGSVTKPIASAKRLAKMSQHKKNNLLLYYAQQEYPKPCLWLSKVTYPIFEPSQIYLDNILQLIKYGASVNMSIPYYWVHKVRGKGTFKPIYLFIKTNNIEATRILLEHGATIDNVISSEGFQDCGLTFAATQEMVELLVSYGASKS